MNDEYPVDPPYRYRVPVASGFIRCVDIIRLGRLLACLEGRRRWSSLVPDFAYPVRDLGEALKSDFPSPNLSSESY